MKKFFKTSTNQLAQNLVYNSEFCNNFKPTTQKKIKSLIWIC